MTETEYRNKLQISWSGCLRWEINTECYPKDCTSHCNSYKSRPVWRDNNISLRFKVKGPYFYIPVNRRSRASEMSTDLWDKMLLKVNGHFVQGSITNEEVRRNIEAATGDYDELLTLVKKRKLRSCHDLSHVRHFGHVCLKVRQR